MEKRVTKYKFIILTFCLGAVVFAFYFAYCLAPKKFLKISFLDVGQGDAILIETPRGGKILIDGGRDKVVLSKLGGELPFFTKNLDFVIATHDDSDHIAGLVDVLKKYDVKVLLYSLPNSESELSKSLMKIAKEKNVKILQASKQTFINTDDGLIVKIFFPIQNMDGSESNEASVVSQIIFGKNKFLFTGDLPQAGEIFLTEKYGEQLDSDVLKLGHHGSDTSTHPNFLQTVSPEVAVVSAGKNNSFGHPHRSVINLIEKFGIKILRTDELGTIHLYSNGINIWRE